MEVTKGMLHDISNIMKLFTECISSMASQGINQWNEHYPTNLIIEEDIMNGYGYIVSGDDGCIAYFSINDEQPTEYSDVTWLDTNGKNLVVHRLAVQPELQRSGIASVLMNYAETYARNHDYVSIRLDVYSANIVGKKFYSSIGFNHCGEIMFPFKHLPFNCMEKVL